MILIDAARGVEPQTEQLFQVARARGIPLIAFVNKYDRPGMEPLEMVDHLTEALELPLSPLTWPVGIPGSFRGVIDRRDETFHQFERVTGGSAMAMENVVAARGQARRGRPTRPGRSPRRSSSSSTRSGSPFDHEAFLRGELIPLLFGSAAWNFGIGLLLDTLRELAPPPRPAPARRRHAAPDRRRRSRRSCSRSRPTWTRATATGWRSCASARAASSAACA